MFRITEDPSSGSLVQYLAKNYKNGSIVSVDMYKVSVIAAYSDPLSTLVFTVFERNSYTVNYTHAQRVRICCHNTELVHVNGHDRISLVVFIQVLYKAP